MKKDTKARILSRCKPAENGCLEWHGYRQPNGYGQTTLNGRLMPAHRALYMAATGESLTRSQDVCHSCDNRSCCNIDHLFVGSRLDNMQDAMKKGRHVSITHPETFIRGEESHRAVLTEENVREIKRMLSEGKSCRSIAESFKITRSGISKIKNNKSWNHVCLN